ncbi:MAG: TIR domain-containing protein [Oscillospiraceae bacterium]|nr:TIR domain-containing protein [Oscillospiraceae bacterium]
MDIFISYSSKEYEKACMIKKVLNENGISTWLAPGDIPPGSNYTREIPRAIRNCKVFLLLLSENAQNSMWVSAELENAFKNEKPIIPFALENCILRDEFDFLLSRCQRIEAYERTADALENLIRRLKVLVGADDSAAPVVTAMHSVEKVTPVETVSQPEESLPANREYKVIHYENGATYEGETVNGVRWGKGKYTSENGHIYEGDYVNGRRTGKGRYSWSDNSYYEGDFLDGDFHGKGRRVWRNGNVHEGDYVKDKRTGKGKLMWPSGSVYEGDFIEDKRTGKGKYTWPSGNYYEGDFVDGDFQGKGRFVWHDGDVYEGDFAKDKRTGKGKYSWPNGDVYEGDFLDGIRTGHGVFSWDATDGRYRKEGTWDAGQLVNGKEFDADGKVIAEYCDGQRLKRD